MAKIGRPRKEIAKETFENLCGIMCTLEDIAGVFECSEDTIQRWCKRTYGERFADVFKKYSGKGKASLRRIQFRQAETNPTMAIWLGKQLLGQRDEQRLTFNAKIDESAKEMDEYFNKRKNI